MATGRDAALDALTACRRLDAWSDGSLKAVSRGLEPREDVKHRRFLLK